MREVVILCSACLILSFLLQWHSICARLNCSGITKIVFSVLHSTEQKDLSRGNRDGMNGMLNAAVLVAAQSCKVVKAPQKEFSCAENNPKLFTLNIPY